MIINFLVSDPHMNVIHAYVIAFLLDHSDKCNCGQYKQECRHLSMRQYLQPAGGSTTARLRACCESIFRSQFGPRIVRHLELGDNFHYHTRGLRSTESVDDRARWIDNY